MGAGRNRGDSVAKVTGICRVSRYRGQRGTPKGRKTAVSTESSGDTVQGEVSGRYWEWRRREPASSKGRYSRQSEVDVVGNSVSRNKCVVVFVCRGV